MEVQKCVIFLKACFLSAKALAQEPEDRGGGERVCRGRRESSSQQRD